MSEEKVNQLIEMIAKEMNVSVIDLKKELIETASNIRFGEYNDTVRNTAEYYNVHDIDNAPAKALIRFGEDHSECDECGGTGERTWDSDGAAVVQVCCFCEGKGIV